MLVAIIGAFPCVSPEILHFTDHETAIEVNSKLYTVNTLESRDSNGNLFKNKNYYYNATAFSQVFLDNTNLQRSSEVIICKITTRNYNSEVSPDCEADSTNPKYNTTIVHEKDFFHPKQAEYEALEYDKLRVAFSKLKKEKFNNLVLAYPLKVITAETIKTIDNENLELTAKDDKIANSLKGSDIEHVKHTKYNILSLVSLE